LINDQQPKVEALHILVIGDLMLDRYTCGVAERVSPEAPILVVKTTSREVRLGGAGNVATNCRALGARVTAVGVIGKDHEGATLQRLLNDDGIQSLLAVDELRCTTVKDRILGQSPHRTPQQILRIDTESNSPWLDPDGQLLQTLIEAVPTASLILISDYGKGFCTEHLLKAVLGTALEHEIPVLVDPALHADWEIYRGAWLIKANRSETANAAGQPIYTHDDAAAAATQLSKRYDIPNVAVTLDRDGMVVHQESHAKQSYNCSPREVSDVTGAGDTVLAVMGVALARGYTLDAASKLAITAAGLQVERQGATTVTWDEIASVGAGKGAPSQSKIVSQAWLANHCAELRQAGRRVVVTNGCFDLLHVGHIACLQEARSHGDLLIVALNSDGSVRRLKGETRPVNIEASRAAMLAALECVDFVVVFEEDTPENLIRKLRPDVLVKGGDYLPSQIAGGEFVASYGGKVIVTRQVPGVSTTNILARGTTLTK
jgi:D-beta-D-heptose 7-phosphate kinase/D-beta-D-heptose 1-phosphate adenosyltransferase